MIVLLRLKHVKQALRMAQMVDSFSSTARRLVECCRSSHCNACRRGIPG